MKNQDTCYVWVWLPNETEPVAAGKLSSIINDETKEIFNFEYLDSYLLRPDAVPLNKSELPLIRGTIAPFNDLIISNALRDSSPDSWGRKVILNKLFGRYYDGNTEEPNEITYMLMSDSDRIGAIDFQESDAIYKPRNPSSAKLEDLIKAKEYIEKGIPLPEALDQAIQHGTSIGGARPKALLEDGSTKYIAKFSATGDTHNVVRFEYVTMRLAALAGLNVAKVKLTKAGQKEALLVERFDREKTDSGWRRSILTSALTLLELDEMQARYASYADLSEKMNEVFADPASDKKELFKRLVFNINCSNSDDHARNHAAIFVGNSYRLSPAYDICPDSRGYECNQTMSIIGNCRSSKLQNCIDAASLFGITKKEAVEIMEHQVKSIKENFNSVCIEADLGIVERRVLLARYLHPYAFDGMDVEYDISKSANNARESIMQDLINFEGLSTTPKSIGNILKKDHKSDYEPQ